ncbi:translation initiation factor Sui1 [Variovorax gossypii]
MATTKSNQAGSTLVYSTEAGGRMCPGCGAPVAQCRCKELKARLPATDGIVRVSHETKGRKGKGVTVVKGVALDAAGLTALGKQLKTACGSGGTVKDGVIEIQGDHRELVIAALARQGYTVKRAGG